MTVTKPLTCRGLHSKKRWAIAVLVAMVAWPVAGPVFQPTMQAQVQTAPIGQGFVITADDLRFIYDQILVAQDHAAGGALLGPGPNQVHDPQLPRGLRTVDGTFNNLVPAQVDRNGEPSRFFGASDRFFPRLLTPVFRAAEAGTSYANLGPDVTDSQPRIISNLIVDQTGHNPAAAAVALNPCGSGGFVCQGPQAADPVTGSFFIPNITPDFGLSAPFNLMFTFFGQFFDHGLDLVDKGGNGNVIMPLQPDDPLFVPGSPTNFMVMTRATVDATHNAINQTTPWVDQNQTYTSHPSHQVFLREYQCAVNPSAATCGVVAGVANGAAVQTGKVLDGGFCTPRASGIAGDNICNIGNWGEVKAQALNKLGIVLLDTDVLDVPLLVTDPYGHFKPGANGFPQVVFPGAPAGTTACRPALPGFSCLEGNPQAPISAAGSARTNHQFLNDIAHNAVPNGTAVRDGIYCDFRGFTIPGGTACTTAPGTYDGDVLDAHFATGDGRGNENIALTTVHNLFHSEHNRLRYDIDRLINDPTALTAAERAAWKAPDVPRAGFPAPRSGWDYNERLFQAARFVTEMEYQHLVFEEFARTIQPLINAFLGGITDINPAITAEFAHTVYRLGHSMLPEVVARITLDTAGADVPNDIRLFDAFLTPREYNTICTRPAPTAAVPHPAPVCSAATLTADKAAGSLVRGLSRQVGNELDEFVVDSVRNTLVGLPLDLPAINIARGRSEGIPPLNVARRQFFAATHDAALAPYANWSEFGLNLKHKQSLDNFIAAYGTHPTITSATTVAAKRLAATALVAANDPFLFAPAATSGLDTVDYWVGGLAERQAAFGGLLGSTFNFVFEKQLEDLQNGDRFYYLQRLDGLDLKTQLEGNSFSELIRRNTDFQGGMGVIFNTADFNFSAGAGALTGVDPVLLPLSPLDTNPARILTMTDGTKVFFDPLHRGLNIVFNGGPGDDRFRADIGDDTLYGNAGNDRLEGNDGNDTILGGDGDDILFGANGDDVLKGGPGNDALSSGPGFGGDILLGGDGNDFLLGGDDGVEHFAGPGNDIIVDGAMRAEGIFGGPGDDWLDGGDGHDGGMFGDDGNVFDLLAGLSPIGGDDVCDGGPGQDNCFGEGGDDIFLPSEGTNKFFGDYGFDWVTYRAWRFPADIELHLLALPAVPLNFNDLRNKYRMVDGASGWDLNDHITGDSRVGDPAAPPELFNLPGTELTAAGAAKIAGLAQFMTDFGQTLPFNAGNILLGGLGSDLLEGKGGNDLIDGDVWLNVQLQATLNTGFTFPPNGPCQTTAATPNIGLCNSPRDLVDYVFSDPQKLNPGNITIVRTIVTPTSVPPPDCDGTVPVQGLPGEGLLPFAPKNCDTAVFLGPRADYTVTANPNGTVTVVHTAGAVRGFGPDNEGTDTLRNIEQLQFADGVITPPIFSATGLTTVPNVVGLTVAQATFKINFAGLTVPPAAITFATNAAPAGTVIAQTPAFPSPPVAVGSVVALVVSSGPAAPAVAGVTVVTHTTAAGTGLALGTRVLTSPAITAAASSLIVAVVTANTQANALLSPNVATLTGTPPVTNSGTALTWTRALRSHVQPGTATEVWFAFTTALRTGLTVSASLTGTVTNPSMAVMTFAGAASTLVGAATATAGGTSGAPSATLNTTRDGSLVVAVGTDLSAAQVMTPPAAQAVVFQDNPGGTTYWVQQSGSAGVAGTTVTFSDAYGPPTRDAWGLTLIEIRRP